MHVLRWVAAVQRMLMYEEADKLGPGKENKSASLHEPRSFAKLARAACHERRCAEKRGCWLPALALEVVRCLPQAPKALVPRCARC